MPQQIDPASAPPWLAQAKPRFRAPGEAVGQDWSALADYLAKAGFAFDPADTPRQFATGFGNLNYLITLDGEPAVLRRPPPGPIPPGANDMAREHTVLSALWRHFPLAPKSLHYCADPAILGAHFLIMQYRPGLSIGGKLPDGMDPREVGPRFSGMLVEILADLHALDPEAAGLGSFGKPAGFLARAVEGWAKRAAIAADGAPSPVAEEIIAWLRQNLVPDRTPTLLHSDFKLDNVLLDPVALAPVAVLDWDMSTRGDPLFDLATMLSYWAESGDPQAMRDLDQMPTAAPGFAKRAEIVEAYARRTGRDVSDFAFYRVLTMFKLVVIFQQIHARYRAGTMTDSRFARLGALSDGLLDFTHAIMKGRAA